MRFIYLVNLKVNVQKIKYNSYIRPFFFILQLARGISGLFCEMFEVIDTSLFLTSGCVGKHISPCKFAITRTDCANLME